MEKILIPSIALLVEGKSAVAIEKFYREDGSFYWTQVCSCGCHPESYYRTIKNFAETNGIKDLYFDWNRFRWLVLDLKAGPSASLEEMLNKLE